jgi:hypothetical protein
MTDAILIPARLTPAKLLPFSLALRDVSVAEKYLLDFRNVGHVEPFGMLFLAALIRQFVRTRRRAQGKDCVIQVINYEEKEYASFMGLFKSFGLDYGNAPGEANGSGTYIPLTRLPISRILRDAREAYRHQGFIVEQEADKIARVLTRDDSGPVTEALAYAIQELMRNVIEHGETTHIWYAGQYWPSKNRVEVAILDEGVGLLPSLRRNPKLKVDSDDDAISLALMPGVSGVAKPTKNLDGDWINTGYGLYMISSLCKTAGDFLLCNYSRALLLSADSTSIDACAYEGLAIRMVLDTSRIGNLNTLLAEYRKAASKPR